MKKLIALLLALSMALSVTACGTQQPSDNRSSAASAATTVAVPQSASECIGKNQIEVAEKFEEAGFKNITTEKVEDLKVSEADQVDSIMSISIKGQTEFAQGQEFDKNDRVVITYHAFQKCKVALHVDFIPNLLFSKYAVRLKTNNETQGTLDHGEDKDFELTLEPGKYSITFEKSDDSSVKGSTDLDVKGDIDLSLEISCYSSEISVKTLYKEDMGAIGENEVMLPGDCVDYEGKNNETYSESLQKAGFTNVALEPVYDLALNSEELGEITTVTIDGISKFERGSIFAKDAAVIIRYHALEADDPVKIEQAEREAALEEVFPKEIAKRAVVVAMTNCQAGDVFTPDGNGYDPAKFHSYSDLGDSVMLIDTDGKWSALDENTWRVDGLILSLFNYGTYVKVSCDVKMEEENYVVSNVDRTLAAKDYIDSNDPSKVNAEHYEPSEFDTFLTVPFALVENDRDSAAVRQMIAEKQAIENARKAHEDWVNSQFSIWNGSHKVLESLIKKQLNDERSYKHIDTKYYDIDNEELKAEVNNILANAGYSQRVEIDDLFIITEFSAKNYFNATIKSTAYGIADYSEDLVILVAIE